MKDEINFIPQKKLLIFGSKSSGKTTLTSSLGQNIIVKDESN